MSRDTGVNATRVRFEYKDSSEVVLRLSIDDLGSLRFALDAGVAKLESHTALMKVLSKKDADHKQWYKSAKETSEQARAVMQGIEDAVAGWTGHRRSPAGLDVCQTCFGTGNEGKHSICRDCDGTGRI